MTSTSVAVLLTGAMFVVSCGGRSTQDPDGQETGGSNAGLNTGSADAGGAGGLGTGGMATGVTGGRGLGGTDTGATGGRNIGGATTGGGRSGGEGGTADGGTRTGGMGGTEDGGTRTGGTGGKEDGGTQASGAGGAETGGTELGGGAPTGGTEAGGAPTGGSAGLACTQSPDPGGCDAVEYGFRHDPELGLCVPYLFDSCDASANRYATRDECLAACHGGEPDLDACTSDRDCVVTGAGCCDACDPVVATDLIALRGDQLEELDELTGCTDVLCEPCLAPTPSERTRQNFYPSCVDGRCTLRDVRNQPFAACETAADCRLRCGTGCCESCGADGNLIAVRIDADLTTEFCDEDPVPCDPCLCDVPESYKTSCIGGYCRWDFLPICEFGVDASCNQDRYSSLLSGFCDEDGTCTCYEGFEFDPETYLCQIPSG
ncbi:MAG: BPTI/Kunitz domain-containing protein [Polyangiaceae bacterium]|nr:BPTI/Kunitz domain-containing protein [Polyangiaceae bacterium]